MEELHHVLHVKEVVEGMLLDQEKLVPSTPNYFVSCLQLLPMSNT